MGYNVQDSGATGHTRMGQRHALHEGGAAWRVPKRARFRPTRVVEMDVVIDNLSVTGAGITSAADAFVRLGQVVELRLGDHWGRVQVMRCRATDDPRIRYWGVEFLDSDRDFTEELSRRLAAYSRVADDRMMRDWG